MEVIKSTTLPKPSPQFQLSVAARLPGNFDLIAQRLSTKPYKYKEGKGDFASIFRCIYFRLATGAFARIGEEGYEPGVLEIELLLDDGRIFYEEDLNEIVSALDLDPQHVHRWRGGEIWCAARAGGSKRKP